MPKADTEPTRRVVRVSRAQVEAAKLKVELDARLGKPTPAIIKMVAKVK